MAVLGAAERNNLPDSAFAYIEPGGTKDSSGKTTPRSLRHFPIHDAAHVRNALARIAQGARFGAQAKAKVLAAAKKFGVEHNEGSDTGRSLESLYPEVRFVTSVPELRDMDGAHIITGYAAKFDKLSRKLGGFVERVMPSAFDRSKGDNWPGVICRYNHDKNMVLGTTGAETLRLHTDAEGLVYEVEPPAHRSDVQELVQRGDVRYSSFSFRCVAEGDDEWGVSDFNYPMRSLHGLELVDVAPVNDPAYFDTSAVSRSMTGAVESLARWVDADPNEVRSYLDAGQAIKFFKRTDRPSAKVPELRTVPSTEVVIMDDPAIAFRSWDYAPGEERAVPEGESVVPEEDRYARDEEEIRAAVKPRDVSQLCMRYHHGEACVRPMGHPADGPNSAEGGHAGLCWGRYDGLPCNQHEGHDGAHTPMTVASRDGEEAEAPVETRDEEPKTLTAQEAFFKMSEIRSRWVELDED